MHIRLRNSVEQDMITTIQMVTLDAVNVYVGFGLNISSLQHMKIRDRLTFRFSFTEI